MGRGRRADAPEIKALKGNPRKQRRALQERPKPEQASQPLAPRVPDFPASVRSDNEKAAFKWVFENLPVNLLRDSDAQVVARWAYWLCEFVKCKNSLGDNLPFYTTESNFVRIHREHPLAKRLDKCEAHLVTLEDRLCLNVVARNNIMHRMFNMPGAHPGGGLFTPDPEDPAEDANANPKPATSAELDEDPLGFIERAGKPLQ